MALEDKVHAFRLHLFRRARELGNVSATCRELGFSRSFYYQLRERFQRYKAAGLHPTRRRGRPGGTFFWGGIYAIHTGSHVVPQVEGRDGKGHPSTEPARLRFACPTQVRLTMTFLTWV